jgi:hypothetical protein
MVRYWRVERTHKVAQDARRRQVCTLGKELQIDHATEEHSQLLLEIRIPQVREEEKAKKDNNGMVLTYPVSLYKVVLFLSLAETIVKDLQKCVGGWVGYCVCWGGGMGQGAMYRFSRHVRIVRWHSSSEDRVSLKWLFLEVQQRVFCIREERSKASPVV